MVDDSGRLYDSRMWQAVERLEAASHLAREEQVSTNARIDAVEKEQVATNVRLDDIAKEQVATSTRIDAVEKEQIATNARLDAIEKEQVAMNARLDILTLRMDRLFYAIIGGTIAVSASVLIHGFISG